MKIIQVIEPAGNIGGVEKIVVDIHNYLTKIEGVHSYIAISNTYVKKMSQVYTIVNGDESIIPIDDLNIVRKIKSYRAIISNIEPDIIHTHARRETVMISVLFRNIKKVRTQHMEEYNRIPKTIIEKKLIYKNIDKWVFTSKTLQYSILKKMNIYDSEVIYNGVYDYGGYDRDKCKNVKIKLIFAGRLTYQKGLDIFIDQISKMDRKIIENIEVLIYGDGEEKQNLIEKVEFLDLSKCILFFDFDKNIIEKIKNADIMIMPSRYEGLPLAMLESMSVSTPVAIHNVGCISEFISHGINGWIIDLESEFYNWEKYILDLLSNKYDILRISKNAYNTYKSRFTLENMCFEYFDLYRSMISKKEV